IGRALDRLLHLAFGFFEVADRAHAIFFVESHEAHALRVASEDRDIAAQHADHHAARRDHHDVVLVDDLAHRNDLAVPIVLLDQDDPATAPSLRTVLLGPGPLAIAVGGHREDRRTGVEDGHAHHLVALIETDAAHAARWTSHRSHVARAEADRHALL